MHQWKARSLATFMTLPLFMAQSACAHAPAPAPAKASPVVVETPSSPVVKPPAAIDEPEPDVALSADVMHTLLAGVPAGGGADDRATPIILGDALPGRARPNPVAQFNAAVLVGHGAATMPIDEVAPLAQPRTFTLFPSNVFDPDSGPQGPIVVRASRRGVLELPKELGGDHRFEVFLADSPLAPFVGGLALDGARPHVRAAFPRLQQDPTRKGIRALVERVLPPAQAKGTMIGESDQRFTPLDLRIVDVAMDTTAVIVVLKGERIVSKKNEPALHDVLCALEDRGRGEHHENGRDAAENREIAAAAIGEHRVRSDGGHVKDLSRVHACGHAGVQGLRLRPQ